MCRACCMAAVAVLYRYADFVTLLGGTEFHLGWIVGVGMVGSLAMRMVLGSWIDRYGAGLLWLGSTLLFVVTCFAHLAVASHTGVAIYLLRIRTAAPWRASPALDDVRLRRAPTTPGRNGRNVGHRPASWASWSARCWATSCSARSRSPPRRSPRCSSPPVCWVALAAVCLGGNQGRVVSGQWPVGSRPVGSEKGERGERRGRGESVEPSAFG